MEGILLWLARARGRESFGCTGEHPRSPYPPRGPHQDQWKKEEGGLSQGAHEEERVAAATTGQGGGKIFTSRSKGDDGERYAMLGRKKKEAC